MKNIILRILTCPLVLGIIWIIYSVHAFRKTYYFLLHGGEWITYAKDDRKTIEQIYLKLKEDEKV